MYDTEQGTEGDGWQLVTLEPVLVNQSHLADTIAAFEQSSIYFQFGEQQGSTVVLFVIPDDLDAAMNIVSVQSHPLTGGCRLLGLTLIGLAVALPSVSILVAIGL